MIKEFHMPQHIISGFELFQNKTIDFSCYGKRAFIVADTAILELVTPLLELLINQGIEYYIYRHITGEPTDQMIYDAKKEHDQFQCDFIIGIGGGSVLDSTKMISLLKDNEDISSLVNDKIERKRKPFILIPTTSGTGSEVTQFSVITDTKSDKKILLKGKSLLPDLVLLDYSLTLSMPPHITASTGFDALTHAIEAYTSIHAQPMSDVFAISAIKRILNYLPIAFMDGNNKQAREQLSLAAMEAGIAFNNSSVTIVHGMSRPIGALFHIPHGISNAMLLETCIRYVSQGAKERFSQLSKEIHLSHTNDTDDIVIDNFLAAIHDLSIACEIPTLKDYGIDLMDYKNHIEKMALDAMESGSPQNTIQKIDKDIIMQIYNDVIS